MKNASQKLLGGAAGLGLLSVILVAANVVATQLRLRADLTSEKLYTLSRGSRQVVRNLPSPVTLKYFFSRSSGEVDTFLKTYATQVENLLREYVRAAGGGVTLETYDPAPDSDEEEWAQQFGIEPQMLRRGMMPMYFGLAAISADGQAEQAIPALSPRTEPVLEYEITRMITRVANPSKPVVGVLSTLPVLGGDDDPMAMLMNPRQRQRAWYAFRELRRDAEVRSLPLDLESVDPDIRTLIVVHPKDLSDQTLYAIDQFLLGGGRLLVFVDPFSVHDAVHQQQQAMMMGGASFASDLQPLFGAWGVTFEQRVVADIQYPTRMQQEENPAFLSLDPTAFTDDLLVSRWNSILMPFAGAFSVAPRDGLTFTPLIETSDTAGLVDAGAVQMGAAAIRAQLVTDGVRRALAGRLEGRFTTAFPDGRPGAEAEDGAAGDDAPRADGHRTEGESFVLLFADTDLLQDDVCVQMLQMPGFTIPQLVSDNINLFVSAVEQTTGDSALLAVRSRGRAVRPFTVVDDLERRAQRAFLDAERDLEAQLRQTQSRLRELQTQDGGQQRLILSPQQQAEIERFREQERRVRRELREVRQNLRRDIESLGVRVKVINILGMPILVGAVGIGYGLLRRRV